jgi:hypothetical protein
MADAPCDLPRKTDKTTAILELLRGGKFRVKAGSWEDHRTALKGERVVMQGLNDVDPNSPGGKHLDTLFEPIVRQCNKG